MIETLPLVFLSALLWGTVNLFIKQTELDADWMAFNHLRLKEQYDLWTADSEEEYGALEFYDHDCRIWKCEATQWPWTIQEKESQSEYLEKTDWHESVWCTKWPEVDRVMLGPCWMLLKDKRVTHEDFRNVFN